MIKLNRIGNKLGLAGAVGILLAAGMVANQMVTEASIEQSSERANRRLARMFAALSATNEAIMRAKCPEELYQLVCNAAVHSGKFFGTTVLLNEPGSPWLAAVAGTGGTDALVKQTRFSIDPDNP